jgi:hypothetical protein
LITSTSLNLVGQVNKHVELVFQPLVLSYVHVKPVHVQLVKIIIPLDTFQQHSPKTFFQPEVGEMEMDEMPIRIKVQNLRIAN